MPRVDVTGSRTESRETAWVRAVEVVEREGELIVRADVPGLSEDQVNVEIDDGNLRWWQRAGFYTSRAFTVIAGTAASAFDTGQPRFDASTFSWKVFSSSPGTSASVASSIRAIVGPASR